MRAFTVRGEPTVYREQRTYVSDSDRTLGYTHLEGISDCEAYDARVTVSGAEVGGSTVCWTATVRAPAARLGAICSGTKAVFEAGIAALAGALPVPLVAEVLPEAVGTVMRAAALDLRGYGDSSLGSGQSTVDDYCADILRVAEKLGARRLVLAGLSYGSWIATSFAMRHPEMLAGLVLSGGCTGMSEAGPDEREAFRLSREVPLNAGQVPADFAPAVVKVLAGPEASDDTRQQLRDSMAAIPAATYRDALVCFTNPLERFDFARLTMPVLLMTGEHDRLAPPLEIRGVAGRIWDAAPRPDVRFEVIAGAGHVCNVEKPEIYSRHLLTYLRRLT